MRKKSFLLALVTMACSALAIFGAAFAQNSPDRELVVVASDPSFEVAKNWVNFLQKQSIIVKHVQPADFDKYKKNAHLVVLGVPGEPGGAGDVVKSLLTREELDWVVQQGNKKLYIKDNVFEKDQTIFLFAAYTQAAIPAQIRGY